MNSDDVILKFVAKSRDEAYRKEFRDSIDDEDASYERKKRSLGVDPKSFHKSSLRSRTYHKTPAVKQSCRVRFDYGISRTLEEAKNRTKRLLSNRKWVSFRQLTHYEEYPKQTLALEAMDTLAKKQTANVNDISFSDH